MAFTITTLAWATLFYKEELSAAGQLQNSIDAIKWGTDYFLKATSKHNRLWVQVGLFFSHSISFFLTMMTIK